jgi:flagellar hook-length control protein FliK
MTDLPLNISSVSAKPAASKPSGNDNVAQQDMQGFGKVLARQVDGTSRPAEPAPTSSGDSAKQDKTETTATATADSSQSLPADLLAVLLAQQSQTDTPAADANLQAALNAQIAASSAGTPDLKTVTPEASGLKASASAALIRGNINSTNIAAPALDKTIQKFESPDKVSANFSDTLNASKGLSDAFKEQAMKELGSADSKLSQRGGVIGELATSAQQPALPPISSGVIAASSPVSIATPVTQTAWADEFSQKITWIATQHTQSAELHLNPPHLGPLDVVLKISGDQASATFTSPHAAVRDAIEQALPKLREMLADNGIMLGNAMVNDQATKNGQDNSSHKTPREMPASLSDAATEATRIQETRVSSISRHNGMVDTFA